VHFGAEEGGLQCPLLDRLNKDLAFILCKTAARARLELG